MPLQPGTRLGPYQVTAKIGEGGMGQVWQATDTQLNRQVALKILPDASAADPDRLARFTREAQILASLNHPNIAAIHGIEKTRSKDAARLSWSWSKAPHSLTGSRKARYQSTTRCRLRSRSPRRWRPPTKPG